MAGLVIRLPPVMLLAILMLLQMHHCAHHQVTSRAHVMKLCLQGSDVLPAPLLPPQTKSLGPTVTARRCTRAPAASRS